MSVRIALVSDDHVLRSRLIRHMYIDRTCLGDGFRTDPTARTALRSAAPYVVLIDSDVNDGLRLCAELASPGGPSVVMIGVPEDGDTAVDALTAGARGIVYKTEPLDDVPKAVDVVCKGQVWAPRHVVVAAWMRFKSEAARQRSIAEPNGAERLSRREREVFRYAATGLRNRDLANRLSISEATVKVHLTHIFQKLGLHGRGELAAAYFGILR